MLGPVLFNIFINDLDKAIEGILIKFADDTKGANTPEERTTIKNDLDRLEEWAIDNKMNLNQEKYKVLHLGLSSSSFPLAGDCWGTLISQPICCCGCRRIFCTVYNGLPLLPIHSCIFGCIYFHLLVLKVFFDVFEPCFLWCCSLHPPVVWFFSVNNLVNN